MTAKEIYKLEPKSISKELSGLKGCYANHLPEIDEDLYELDNNEKVEIKNYVDYCFDGRRTWTLSSVWYDGNPIMIIQNAGREGDDHYKRFITDKDKFIDMVSYIRTLLNENDDELDDLTDENMDCEELTEFYGHSMKEFYDTTFIPNHKIGDVIEVSLPKDYVSYDFLAKEWINVNVEILDVTDVPYNTYRVKEIDRKIHRKRWNDDNDKTVIKFITDISDKETVLYEDFYHRLSNDLKFVNC